MYCIGLMSGTSIDGVDAALVEFDDRGRPHIHATTFVGYDTELKQRLHDLCEKPGRAREETDAVDRILLEKFAQAVRELIDQSGIDPGKVAAIGSHGQTIDHQPHAPKPYSLQIGDPGRLSGLTGIPVIGDFRTADIQAGGQGAPLAPALHNACFRSPDESRVILNIGGIANITVLPAYDHDPIIGFDTGPGNTLLDYWTRVHLKQDYDRDGAWAASGTLHPALLESMLAEPYFAVPPPKSTGRELFNPDWLQARLHSLSPAPEPADVQATLLQLTARSICHAIDRFASDTQAVYACGGGCHNRQLMLALERGLGERRLGTTAELGIDPDWVEAVTFAWLAWQNVSGRPGNLPSVTGAREAVVLGTLHQPDA